MKKLLFIATLLLCTSVTFGQWGNKRIRGNGKMTTQTRTTSDYDGIKCAGSFNYILVKGSEGKITLEGEENLLDEIIVEVKNNNLVVKTENNVSLNPSGNRTITITIPFSDIDEVALAGSGNLMSRDEINSTDFKAALAGSGNMELSVKASSVKGAVAGSGNLVLKGETNEFEAKIAGSGDLRAFDLVANDVEVSVAGSGDAEIVCNGRMKARVAGSGDITYKGKPTSEDTKVSGSGDVSSYR